MKYLLIIVLMISVFSATAQEWTVMTYNIRLDHAGDGPNRWDLRKARLVDQVRFYEPHVLGIQEGLPQQVKYLDSVLVQYAYVGVGRDDGKEKGEFSAIFYRKDLFANLKSGTFWLSETPDVPSKGWDAALPRVCTYILLEDRASAKKFWVLNTHFDHIGEKARAEAVKLMVRKVQEMNTEKLPVVVMGDFNLTPETEPISLMRKAMSDSRDLAELTFGPLATFNGFDFTQAPANRIDYIFVQGFTSVKKHAVLTDSYDQKYLSDHFAVLAVLGW